MYEYESHCHTECNVPNKNTNVKVFIYRQCLCLCQYQCQYHISQIESDHTSHVFVPVQQKVFCHNIGIKTHDLSVRHAMSHVGVPVRISRRKDSME